MGCPMFIDSTRMCLEKIDCLHSNTFDYCVSDKHAECPFFRALNNAVAHCDFIERCVVFKYFGSKDFAKLVEFAGRYCLSENNTQCKRYQTKKSGNIVPDNLLPDGSTLPK